MLQVEVDCQELKVVATTKELLPANKMVYQPNLDWYPTRNYYYTLIMLGNVNK